MTQDGAQRRLTTILAADAVGYSRLIGVDDEDTVARLIAYRRIIEGLIARHHGSVAGTAGDSVIAEFPSAVEAVRCAVAIQEELAARNSELPDDRAIRFRIGISIGDVIVERDELHGDGVNIAVRLEGLAEAGGICVSGSAFEQVRNKVSVAFEDIGAQRVKNIAEPVPTYRIRIAAAEEGPANTERATTMKRWRNAAMAAGIAVVVAGGGLVVWERYVHPALQVRAFRAAVAQPLPSQPSIAVLPFVNASANPAQDYFSDGITEDIITDLTKVSGLFVVGRNSSFSYKGKVTQAKFVGRDLGVRYVLQGSVRRESDRVRISAHLVDAATGRLVWSERQDRVLKDIFAVQDDVAESVVTALAVSFKKDERENLRQQYVQNFAAYDRFLKGRALLSPPTERNLLASREHFVEAVRLDPGFAGGYAGVSLTHSLAVRNGHSSFPPIDIQEAFDWANKGIAKNANLGIAHLAMASAHLMKRDQKKALESAEKAYAMQPGDANTNAILGFFRTFAGEADKAIAPIDKALNLERDKHYQARFQFFRLFATYSAKKYDEAIKSYEAFKALAECKENCAAYAAAAYVRKAESPTTPAAAVPQLMARAKEIIRPFKKKHKECEMGVWRTLYKNFEDNQYIQAAVRKACE